LHLRKGKTRTILESSINCALLAVEIYNKPRIPFRVESYITHIIVAWTRLLHAYFNQTIGDKFYYKEKGKYKIIDGEKKAWELKTCIIKYGGLSDSVKGNLEFFIKLRNKIEHRSINKDDIGLMIFGECQSVLYNYENELIKLFGNEYALNENLAYSLQFSRIRTSKQIEASKQLLSTEVKEIKEFIENYRTSLDETIFNSQEFSIKLIQIPKITNTNRNDIAVEFVNWNSLSENDKKNYEKLAALVKDKVIKAEVINPGKLKPGKVIAEVNKKLSIKFNHTDHKYILAIFGIRPYNGFEINHNPFETNTKYCHFDEAHNDYLYQDSWVKFLVANIASGKLSREFWREKFGLKEKIDIKKYEIMN
jgi:hypothetical protein